MKKIKFFFAFMGVFALLFYACSKDENNVSSDEKATLSFGAIVQDLADKGNNKQAIGDIPACSEDDAAYVEIILMQGDTEVVGAEGAPFRVDLVAGQVFTEEVPELELDPGTYSLEHFAVFNAAGDPIWLAPKTGSEMANFVNDPLPLSINLGAGVKKYVDVSVLCFDNRDVNEYGYLFFDFNETEAFEFCFFANYCPPEDEGRHETANYSVNIWLGTDDTGTPLYTNVSPVTSVNAAGDYTATTTCFALPVNDDLNEPYLYYEVTLLDWPGNYGTVAPNTVISGTLTAQDVIDNFDGDDRVNYEHLRFNCDGETPPPGDDDDDGVPNEDDICPGFDDNADADGDGIPDGCDNCPDTHTDMDDDGDCIPNNEDPCPYHPDDDCDDDDGVGEGCETAYMFGDVELNSLDYPGNNWGWGLEIDADDIEAEADGVWEIPFWAGAGQNDTSKGWQAGNIVLTLEGDNLEVEFVLNEGVTMNDTHIYVGSDWPESRAPGQFDLGDDDNVFDVSGIEPIYVIVHAEVCGD